MDYHEMSNEKLHEMLLEKFPGAHFKEVADYNRQTAISILMIQEDQAKGPQEPKGK